MNANNDAQRNSDKRRKKRNYNFVYKRQKINQISSDMLSN